MIFKLQLGQYSRYLLCVFLLLAAFVYKIYLSVNYGKLSVETTYDDVSYFSEGIRLYSQWKADSLSFLDTYFSFPPGSPLLALLSMASQSFFHGNLIAIYGLFGLLVIFLFFILCRIILQNHFFAFSYTLLFLLSPISTFYLMNYRPDPLFSLLFAIIAAMTFVDFKKNFWLILYGFWLLFLIKPHFAAFEGILIIYFLVTSSKEKFHTLRSNRKKAYTFGAVSLILGAVFFNLFKDSLKYIYANTYGGQVNWWKGEESVFLQLKSNIYLLVKNIGGDSFFVLFIFVFFVLLFFGEFRKIQFKSIYPILLLSLGCFLIATFGGTPSPFFFLPFLTLTILFVIFILKQLIFSSAFTRVPVICLVGVLVIRGAFPVVEWGADGMKDIGTPNAELSAFISEYSEGRTLVTFIGPVNADALNVYTPDPEWDSIDQRFQFSFLPNGSKESLVRYVDSMKDFNSVVFLTRSYGSTNLYIPNNRYQTQIEKLFQERYKEVILEQAVFLDFNVYKLKNSGG